MKFLASKTTPLSVSQVVAGSAPMKRKTWRIGLLRVVLLRNVLKFSARRRYYPVAPEVSRHKLACGLKKIELKRK